MRYRLQLARREGRHLQDGFWRSGRGFCGWKFVTSVRRRPGHHARSACVRTARCWLHWRRRGSADLPFGSGDSRKRWPGPGQDESPVNPHSGAPKGERSRKGSRLFPVTGAVLYPLHRSVLRFPRYRGSRKSVAHFRADHCHASQLLSASALRERDRLHKSFTSPRGGEVEIGRAHV